MAAGDSDAAAGPQESRFVHFVSGARLVFSRLVGRGHEFQGGELFLRLLRVLGYFGGLPTRVIVWQSDLRQTVFEDEYGGDDLVVLDDLFPFW